MKSHASGEVLSFSVNPEDFKAQLFSHAMSVDLEL